MAGGSRAMPEKVLVDNGSGTHSHGRWIESDASKVLATRVQAPTHPEVRHSSKWPITE